MTSNPEVMLRVGLSMTLPRSRLRGNGRFDVPGTKCSRALTASGIGDHGFASEVKRLSPELRICIDSHSPDGAMRNRTSISAYGEKLAETRFLAAQCSFSRSVLKQEIANSGQLRGI